MSNLALFYFSSGEVDVSAINGMLVTPDDDGTTECGTKCFKFAAQDWENFLMFRQAELKPNGRILVGMKTLHK